MWWRRETWTNSPWQLHEKGACQFMPSFLTFITTSCRCTSSAPAGVGHGYRRLVCAREPGPQGLPRQMESGAATVKQSSQGNWPVEPLPIKPPPWHHGTQRQASSKENRRQFHVRCLFSFFDKDNFVHSACKASLSCTFVVYRWQHSADSVMQRWYIDLELINT